MSSVRHWSGLALGATLAVVGCAEPVKDINRVQPNALRKDLFKGTWYFARTVVDAPYETKDAFVGDRQEYLFKEDFPAYKVRWRIEEDHLLACRVDEVVVGANSNGARVEDYEDNNGTAADTAVVDQTHRNGETDPQNSEVGVDEKFPCHHPVASFAIQGHFDIQRNYNPATGEQSNVIDENMSDRPWYEREYFRVDWTDIGLTDMGYNLGTSADLGWLTVQSPYYVQAEDGDCRQTDADGNVSYADCQEGYLPPVVQDDSILITNRMTIGPDREWGGLSCFFDPNCALNEIGMRLSFMKVPERPVEEQYVPLPYPDDHFERYGVWRVNKTTYLPGRSETDFHQYLATRWNIFQKWRDAKGNPLPQPTGLRPIDYYLNKEFPIDLKPTAFKMAKEWSDAYAGIHPDVDVTTACKVTCNGGKKDIEACTASDTDFAMNDKCIFRLHENSGEQFMGDLRYSMIAYIQDASYGQPCGVGGPANDPETGEMINGVAYVYGNGCFDYLETRVMDMIDLLCAQHSAAGDELPAACDGISEEAFTKGLRIAKIWQSQGNVLPVPVPVYGRTAFAEGASSEHAKQVAANFTELKNHPEAMRAGREKLRGTALERALVTDEMAAAFTGGATRNASELTQEQVDAINPLDPFHGAVRENQAKMDAMAARAVEPAEYIFNDGGIWAFAKRHMDESRSELRQFIREQAFRSVTLHELGHNMGLRHNFISSFDRVNYFPEYWDIKKQVRAAFKDETGRDFSDLSIFQGNDETGAEFDARVAQWSADRETIRQMERDAGIKEAQYSSIMDYAALYYTDWHGLGSYDKAAMRFLHAGLVDRSRCTKDKPEDCDLSDANRDHVKWYGGGQLCGEDGDCPASGDGQKCRYNDLAGAKVCSSWDEDEADANPPHFILRHKFCSDERVNDQPFCNRFDEGDSSEEIVRNMVEQYENMFVFRNYRAYRGHLDTWAYFDRILQGFIQIGDQMQSFLYKSIYEKNFPAEGPGGRDDMFRATIYGFEFLGNILARPESGPYKLYKDDQVFERYGNDVTQQVQETDEALSIPVGIGKPLYSSYERGYFGEIERLSYIGTFYDKLAALLVLTARDFGTQSYNNEERFYLNFYDFFPQAYIKMLTPYITGDTQAAGLTYDRDTKTLHPRRFWDGSNDAYGIDPSFDPNADAPTGVRLEPGASTYLGLYALIWSSTSTPIYFDLSFKNSLRAFELGGNSGFSIDSHNGIGGVDPQDLETYESPLTHRTFVAVKMVDAPSIAASAIERCQTLADRYNGLKAQIEQCEQDPAACDFADGLTHDTAVERLDDLDRRLGDQEDALSNMVYLNDMLGVGAL